MKKLYSLVAFLAVAAGFVGCSVEDVIDTPEVDTTTLVEVKASTDAPATRTALSEKTSDSKFNVLWSEGDKIMIGDREFILSTGEGTTEGTFSASEAPADGSYTVYYPSTYRGTAWPDQVYNTTDPNSISGAPMVATTTVSDGQIEPLSFTNVGGVLRYTVKGNKTIKSINVKGNGIDISLDCGAGVALTSDGTVFNFALPSGTYTDAMLSFEATDGTMATLSAKSFVVTRNKVSLATIDLTSKIYELHKDSPVGTIGMFHGREAIVADLGGNVGRVAIATKNKGASEGNINGEYYSIMDLVDSDFVLDGKGWYVPSEEELSLLCALPSVWENGGRSWTIGAETLFLPAAGYTYDKTLMPGTAGAAGVYLSTGRDNVYYHTMNFSSESVFMANNVDIKWCAASVRLFHKMDDSPVINDESATGTVGMFYGKEGILVDLGDLGKVVFATSNENAARPSDFGTLYTPDNLPAFSDKWRLPTREEFARLFTNYQGVWTVQNGVPGMQFTVDGQTLFLPAVGYNQQTEGTEGVYMTQTQFGNGFGYMSFSQNSALAVVPNDDVNGQAVPVRLVHDHLNSLSAASAEGEIGYIDGRRAIVANLGGSYGKVAISMRNEGANSDFDPGTYYVGHTDVKKFNSNPNNGWYLASKDEFLAFYNAYKDHMDPQPLAIFSGIKVNIGGNILPLPYSGYKPDRSHEIDGQESMVSSWTSTVHNYRVSAPDGGVEFRETYWAFLVIEDSSAVSSGLSSGVDEAVPEYSEMPVRLFHKLQ
ncbi:MAG: fimbrillin family protein [Bacteroidales bacterium]|nr:fimbrillin family protein [Bacteroidales bacterium]